jgi:hypothetical protein
MLRKSPSPAPSHGSSLSVDMDKWCWDGADEIALTDISNRMLVQL